MLRYLSEKRKPAGGLSPAGCRFQTRGVAVRETDPQRQKHTATKLTLGYRFRRNENRRGADRSTLGGAVAIRKVCAGVRFGLKLLRLASAQTEPRRHET